jgi:hypothetical protein
MTIHATSRPSALSHQSQYGHGDGDRSAWLPQHEARIARHAERVAREEARLAAGRPVVVGMAMTFDLDGLRRRALLSLAAVGGSLSREVLRQALGVNGHDLHRVLRSAWFRQTMHGGVGVSAGGWRVWTRMQEGA